MRVLPLLAILFLLPAAALAAIDYQLEISLYPGQQRLAGEARIDFGPRQGKAVSLLISDRCELLAVEQSGTPLPYKFRQGTLQFTLLTSEPVVIRYQGHFTDALARAPIHNEDPSYGISASISHQGTYLSGGVNWYPRLIDAPEINYKVTVYSPANVVAVTSGKRLEQSSSSEGNRSVWLIDYPLYGLNLAAGNYQIFENSDGEVPIYAYFYPQTAGLAASYLKEARAYLNLYQKLFGPYPFHKFAIVENFFPTGYGLPSWTLLGSSVIKLPFIVKTSLGHEMAHSWWGTGIRVDYAQGNWSEGLTTYVADYLYQERSSASAALAYRLKILRDYASLVNKQNSFPINRFRSRNDKASQAIGYGKVAMVFHMLRQQVGEEVFWSGLRKIARERMFTSMNWDDFRKFFSDHSGQELQVYFQQWLPRTVGPRLALTDVTLKAVEEGYLVSGKLVQQEPFYNLPVKLELQTEQTPFTALAELTEAEQAFQFQVADKPLSLTADPQADLFRILAPEEIPSTINAIRGSNQLLVLQADDNLPSEEAQQMLLAAMRKENLEIRRLAEVTEAELARNDLLIFGSATKLTPAKILNQDDQLSFPGQQASLADHSTFIVSRNPFAKQRHAAWFLSRDQTRATRVARKIPHYGKYSYLLFEGDSNQLKGIWDAPESPLRIEF